MKMSSLLQALAALLPGTHWIGGWVNPRASLDIVHSFYMS